MNYDDIIAELQATIARMQSDINDLKAYKVARMRQQITMPLDETSKNLIGSISEAGLGSKARTQSITIGSTPATITVPAAYSGTMLFNTPNGIVEIPFL